MVERDHVRHVGSNPSEDVQLGGGASEASEASEAQAPPQNPV